MMMLRSCEINYDNPPDASQAVVAVNGVPLGTQDNLFCITGGEGTGKSNYDKFLEEYNESFYTDLLGIANLSENTIKYSNAIFEKAYKKYSNKNIVKIYANFLIEIKEYRKAEDILMKYIVNNEDNLDEYALLKTLYTKENNKQKLENLKKILRNKI